MELEGFWDVLQGAFGEIGDVVGVGWGLLGHGGLSMLTPAQRTSRVRITTARLCLALGGRRCMRCGWTMGGGRTFWRCGGMADLRASRSSPMRNDFRADRKWHHYREFADALYFAVGSRIFPRRCCRRSAD